MGTKRSRGVLVVDDNQAFVESLVDALGAKGLRVEGCTPGRLLAWCKGTDFDFDLVLLDMRLGVSSTGQVLNAGKVLPHVRTYSPRTKVVVFSQQDILPAESVRCLEVGALAVIPKALSVHDLVSLVEAYPSIGNQREAGESLLRVLWETLKSVSDRARKGEYMEMFVINLFNSISGFRVVDQNVLTLAGEIDVVVENTNSHVYWIALKSVHLVFECKNQAQRVGVKVANQLHDLVETRGRLSHVGVIATMSEVTKDFKTRRRQILEQSKTHIFVLGSSELQRLLETQPEERERCLREIFERQ